MKITSFYSLLPYTWMFQMLAESLFMKNTEQYNSLNYIYLKIFLLCKYTVLPATVNMLQTFLEAILWKSFQLFRRILKDIISITKAPSM